jgi:hypothetical protein
VALAPDFASLHPGYAPFLFTMSNSAVFRISHFCKSLILLG